MVYIPATPQWPKASLSESSSSMSLDRRHLVPTDGESVVHNHSMPHNPTDKRVVGRQLSLQVSLQCRLQCPHMAFDQLYRILNSPMGLIVPRGAELMDNLDTWLLGHSIQQSKQDKWNLYLSFISLQCKSTEPRLCLMSINCDQNFCHNSFHCTYIK